VKPPAFKNRSVPDSVVENFAAPLGHFVISWSFVETGVALWSDLLAADVAPANKVRFSAQIKLIKEACSKALIGEALTKAMNLFEKAEEIADVRYTVTHGSISHYESDTQRLLFVRLQPAPKDEHGKHQAGWITKERYLSVANLDSYTEQAREVGGQLTSAARRYLELASEVA
jgi:hypothetical protein